MTAAASTVVPIGNEAWVFHDGAFIRAGEVALRASTQALQYGTGVFEGIRCYRSGVEEGVSNLFRARDHYRRLLDSASLLRIDVPYNADDLVEITVELLRRNQLSADAYVRPVAYKLALEPGTPVGVRLRSVSSCLSILAMPMPQYPKADGISCGISSWRRIPDASLPARAKICGAYANNALAVDEATAAGFDDALFLNTRGTLSEGGTSNVFLVRDGAAVTPDPGSDILEGITRAAVAEILREAGIPVTERSVARSELYTADEVFLTGTGCEVVAVVDVDHRRIGEGTAGPVTKLVQDAYQSLVRATSPRSAGQLTRIEFTGERGTRE